MSPKERIEEAKNLEAGIIKAIRLADAKSREQLIEILEEELRRLRVKERIDRNKESYEPIFINSPPLLPSYY